MFKLKPTLCLALLGLVLAGPACSGEQDGAPAGEQTKTAEEAGIMQQPMDGSSLASFEAGLEKVKAEAGEDAYRKLNNALKYRLTYDLAVKRNKEALYKKLDGQTPDEIIENMRNP